MKKKILFIPYTFSLGGGAEKILAFVLSNLPSDKYDLYLKELVHFDNGNDVLPSYVDVLSPLINMTHKRSFILYFKNKLLILLLYIKPSLVKIFLKKESNYDIIVSFNYLTPCIFANTIQSNKKISWIHGSIEDLNYRIYRNPLKRLKYYIYYVSQRNALKKSNTIVAISKKTYNSIVSLYPNMKEKTLIIYNGYDFDLINKKANFENITSNKVRIISIGRLDKNKNYSLIINSLGVLKYKYEFEYLIIGEGESRFELEELIKHCELESCVKLLGYVKNPYPYISSSDILCVSSYSEGFPTVIVEGMALGKPFISTNVAGSLELSCENRCGLIVDTNVSKYSNALSLLFSDEMLRIQMGVNCSKEVLKYSIDKQIQSIQQIFDN